MPNELNDSYQGNNHKRRRCPQKERKSKSHRRVSLTLNSHAGNEGNSSDIPPRKIGVGGHYYEFVVCDSGGDLLCCDTCPSTYHMQFLCPPHESVPAGNWQCQNCSTGTNFSTSLSSLHKSKKEASSNMNSPAGALHSLADTSDQSVVIDEKQNDVIHNGDAKRRENSYVNGIIVYTRRAKKKTLEEGVGEPSIDTSGLFNYTTVQSESAEKADKFVEKDDLNASMKQKESQGSKMLLQSMNTTYSTQIRNVNWADRLWLPRDTLQELLLSKDSMLNNARKVPPRSTETIKEKYARLRSRQKQKIALRTVAPSSRIGLDAGITESVRVHTPQNGLKQPVSLTPLTLTYTSPSVDSCINSCLNLPISRDPRNEPVLTLFQNPDFGNQEMMTFWSGQELDSLWVGVRRFGQGSWEKMLKDKSLYFAKHKIGQDLAKRWDLERLKILNWGGVTTTRESDNVVSTDLRLNSWLHLNPRKPVTQKLLLGGINGNCMANIDLQLQMSVDEKQFVITEENGFSSEGTISE